MTIQYIPDLIGEVVAKVNTTFSTRPTNPFQVYYDFGHHEEIIRNMKFKDEAPSKPLKYPLIWLVTPFQESIHSMGLYATATLHLVIANDTNNVYSMPERRDKIFLPILYPIWAELMKQLQNSKRFQISGIPEHEKMDLQYAKVTEGKNLFNEYVDVIDITKLKLVVHNKNC